MTLQLDDIRVADMPKSGRAFAPTRRHVEWKTLPRGRRYTLFADMALQILCDQIQRDYTAFYKRFVGPELSLTKPLSLSEGKIIIAMGSYGRPMTGREIATSLRALPSGTSRALAVLLERGLISVDDCPDDSRALCNVLTEKGRALWNEIMERWSAAIRKAEFLTGLTLERGAFSETLATLHAVKDRAHAYASYRPGRLGQYKVGMSRPAHADRHDADTSYTYKDSYLRFYAELASQDYLKALRTRAVKPTVAGRGINLRDLRVAMCVDFYGVPMSQSEIAGTLRLDTATVTRAVQSLDEARLVTLGEDRQDSRVSLVSLSDRGHAMAECYRERCTALNDRVEAHFSCYRTEDEAAKILKTIMGIRDRAATFAGLNRLPDADLP